MSVPIAIVIFTSLFLVVYFVGKMIIQPAGDDSFTLPANAFGSMTESLSHVVPHSEGKRKRIQTELSDAGKHHRNALINFLSMRNVALMGWVLLCLMYFVLSDTQGFKLTEWFRPLMVAGGGLLAIFAAPRILLSSMASSRKKKIENGLPDALDMIAMSVEGGLPLERALNRVAKEVGGTHDALSDELRIIARQSEAGSFEGAIGAFGKRTSIADVAAWSAIVKQNQSTGGNVVGSLRDYADRMRSNRRQRVEKAGATASVKLLLPVVLFLAPPVFIVLIGPGLLDFRDFILREQVNHAKIVREASLTRIERLITGESER